MSIQQLTTLSYVFCAMAVFFAAVSAVMFFKFEIWRIWKIMRGKGTGSIIRERPTVTSPVNAPMTEKLPTQTLSTEKLSLRTLPLQSEETIPLEAIELVLVQDITYTHDSQ